MVRAAVEEGNLGELLIDAWATTRGVLDDERVVDARLTRCVLLWYRSLMYDDHVTPLRVMTNAGTVRVRLTFELVQQSRFEADARARDARRWIRMTNV